MSLTVLVKPASSLCRMNCAYCFYRDEAANRQQASMGIMKLSAFDVLAEKALAYAEGPVSFMFQGGEPTLAGLDFFRAAVESEKRLNKKGVIIHNAIQTNGMELTAEWAEFFKQNDFFVGLSLDGTRKLHDTQRKDCLGRDTYARALSSANLLKRAGVEYNVLCVVTNLTARSGRAVYESLREHRYIQFINCLDPLSGERTVYSLTEKRFETFLNDTFECYYRDFMRGDYVSVRNFDNYINMLCGAPPENCAMNGVCSGCLTVEADGGVYPCDFFVLDAYRLGNIAEDEIGSMLGGEVVMSFVERSRPVPEKCRGCKWYPLCRNGCMRERDADGINRFCGAYSAFFEKNYPRMCEIAARVRG